MHDKNVMLCDDYFLNRGYQKYERTQFQKPDDMYMYNFQNDLMIKTVRNILLMYIKYQMIGCQDARKTKSGTSHFTMSILVSYIRKILMQQLIWNSFQTGQLNR